MLVCSVGWRYIPSGNGLSTDECGELQHSTLSVRTRSNDTDVLGVLDSNNDASSQLQFLPSLSEVDNVNTYILAIKTREFGDEKKERDENKVGC